MLNEFSSQMLLQIPYSADAILGGDSTKTASFDSAFIESTEMTYVFRTKKELKKIKTTHQGLPLEAVQERILQQGWVLDKAEKAKS